MCCIAWGDSEIILSAIFTVAILKVNSVMKLGVKKKTTEHKKNTQVPYSTIKQKIKLSYSGFVVDYRTQPGNYSRWVFNIYSKDSGPTGESSYP